MMLPQSFRSSTSAFQARPSTKVGAGASSTLPAAALFGLCALLFALPAQAATVSGRIEAGASIEAPAALDVTIDAWTCGKDGKIADPRLVLSEERGLADVVVRLRGEGEAPAWPAPETPVKIDQKGCVFLPHVVVIGPGETLDVGNSDPTLHNFHTQAKANKTVNRAQPRGMNFETSFKKPEIQKVVCDVHYWMSAVVVVTDTAYTAVTDAEGNFEIGDVPAGSYTVELWHEELGERSATLEVAGDAARFTQTWEAGGGEAKASVEPIAVASCGCRARKMAMEAAAAAGEASCGAAMGCGCSGAAKAEAGEAAHACAGEGSEAAPAAAAPAAAPAAAKQGCGCGKR